MTIQIPELALVILAGASSSGKSSFARQWFQPSEVVSSDACRAMVSNDENSMEASADAFDLLYYIVGKRLKRGLLTVVDATNVRPEDRKRLVQLAREYYVMPVALVLNMRDRVCLERNKLRTDRQIPPHAIIGHVNQLRRGLGKLRLEGFKKVYEWNTPEQVAAITALERVALWTNKTSETGPFDIIGDVHGCYDELCSLLVTLGYSVDKDAYKVSVHNNRKLVFIGDLVDRGPNSPAVLKLVMQAVQDGAALCVPGNHDIKLLKWLQGKNVQLTHGLEATTSQLATETEEFKQKLAAFLDGLISHYVLDGGKLVVAHAGLKENMQGRGAAPVRDFCLYGETTGETDEFGLPVRFNWALEYRGQATVVYGHTPVVKAEWLNNTIDIDTGCVFGGKLTALRYPERELVSVNALQTYVTPTRPLQLTPEAISLQQLHDALPDIADIIGKQQIHTRLLQGVTIREGHSAAALEVMSRYAVNPQWLIYLPPTMSPSETSNLPDYLEHPEEAWQYYQNNGVTQVICEEKHMGSRAVVIICKNKDVVKERFGITDNSIGICYTRTGRAFFTDKATEQAFLQMVQTVLTERDFWTKFDTDWVCLDTELMPWSAKAQALLQQQYAATGAAARNGLQQAVSALQQAGNNPDILSLLNQYTERATLSKQFTAAYGRYCWEVKSLNDYKLAPFHILATEGRTYFDKTHEWHMQEIAKFCGGEGNPMIATNYTVITLENAAEREAATAWWLQLTAAGGEGMVVKPMDYIVQGKRGLIQPAVKIRGTEYLRIIYGAEYTRADNLKRLKKRGLQAKRSMALREFALGVEAIESFVARHPLRKIHQCVTGVLALESEPVDPRL
ncbi:polynucleotide kinase-phosphatase [Filimonas lacunae]|uniref:Polynucleotide kinase-phosphatase n=1 Tax=Filimonas lacunae TaxID=477680 RepID=A0A173MCX5_9BACT|nr:polynucleotide kinase-phosphatase [Filimonas lacunae]BAV05308.1 protein serine-threonine phosphatase [Filimonas lacunae]SIT22061.1 polynucleotide kinase-phosphatase [Filimonas lacunae]